MTKEYTISGFLYHAPTEQVLLFQPDEESTSLSIFTDTFTEEKDEKLLFQKLILSQIGVDLNAETIYKVYNYVNKKSGAKTFIFYAEVEDTELDFDLGTPGTVGWFPLKLIPKLNLPKQSKHDIVIGQRVIDHNERQKQEQISG